ncbi:MAG: ribonuclease HI [Bacteroidetes bacterium]|nr:MAG: ribonuclease HI [Bacteroidota bacterium]
MNKITIFTDGSARGNPGPGGYGVVLLAGKHRKELSEGYRMTTNNRMELLAVIRGLQALKTNQYPVEIYTDSRYVCDAVTKGWLNNWIQKGFKDKKNPDLWMMLHPMLKTFKPSFHWVKGHAGHPLNERCDQLATEAADSGKLGIDTVFEQVQKAEKDKLL